MNKTQLIELLQALLELMKDDEFMEELENHSHKICPLCGFDCEDEEEEEEDEDWEEVTENVVTPESKAEECIHLENIIDHLCSAFGLEKVKIDGRLDVCYDPKLLDEIAKARKNANKKKKL